MRAILRALVLSALIVTGLCADTEPNKSVIVLLGAPGSGKTTQAARLKTLLDLPVVSMSDILRREGGGRRSGLNKALKAQVAGGDLVNDETANALVRQRVTRKDAARGFILDGYPATVKQAEYFDGMLTDLGLSKPVIIHLSVPDSVADTRLSNRGRADDKPANIERRIVEYRDQAPLILGRYPQAIVAVDGTQSPEAVAAAVQKALGR